MSAQNEIPGVKKKRSTYMLKSGEKSTSSNTADWKAVDGMHVGASTKAASSVPHRTGGHISFPGGGLALKSRNPVLWEVACFA